MRLCNATLFVSTSWIAFAPQAAFGQIAPTDAPPNVTISDPVGADLASGQFNRKAGTISIGDTSTPSLSFDFLETSLGAYGGTPYRGGVDSPKDYDLRCDDIENLINCNYQRIWLGFEILYTIGGDVGDGDYFSSDSNNFQLQRKDGTLWRFSRIPNLSYSGSLKEIVYPDGRTLAYSGSGNLRTITSSDGFQLRLTMADGNYNAVRKAVLVNLAVDNCAPDQVECSFSRSWPTVNISFSKVGNVSTASVQDAMGNAWSASQTSSGASSVTQVSTPSGRWYKFWRDSYGQSSQFVGQSRISKYQDTYGTWSYNHVFSHLGDQVTTTSTSPLNNKWSFYEPGGQSNAGGHILTNPNNEQTVFKFNPGGGHPDDFFHSDGLVSEAVSPNGRRHKADYRRGAVADTRLISASNQNDILTYHSEISASCSNRLTCNKPEYVVDANGARTDYEYSGVHGGVTVERLPADASGVRRRNIYTYGQRSAQIGSGSGSPIWKLITVSYCSAAEVCDGTSNQIITEYGYDRNLLVSSVTVKSGTGDVLSRTAISHDDLGNVVEIDGPAEGAQDKTFKFYDLARHEIGSVDAAGAVAGGGTNASCNQASV